MVSDGRWFLGPLGDLRELVCPEPDMTLNQVSYGGTFQGLSGARSRDFTGTKAEYEFELKWLDQVEYDWLNALDTRMVPGPLYLIDPFKKNRMSIQGCKMTRPLVQYPQMQYKLSADRPAELTLPIQSLNITSWASYADVINIQFDRGYVIPVNPLEWLTFSVYMKASAAATGRLYVDYLDRYGAVVSSYYETKSVVTGWQRNSMTRQMPSTAYAIRFYWQTALPRTELYFCAPQVESGTTVSEWEMGGGANTVIVESLETSSHIFPTRNTNLKLLEA